MHCPVQRTECALWCAGRGVLVSVDKGTLCQMRHARCVECVVVLLELRKICRVHCTICKMLCAEG